MCVYLCACVYDPVCVSVYVSVFVSVCECVFVSVCESTNTPWSCKLESVCEFFSGNCSKVSWFDKKMIVDTCKVSTFGFVI